MSAFQLLREKQEKQLKEQAKREDDIVDREFTKHQTTYDIHKKKIKKIKPKKEKRVDIRFDLTKGSFQDVEKGKLFLSVIHGNSRHEHDLSKELQKGYYDCSLSDSGESKAKLIEETFKIKITAGKEHYEVNDLQFTEIMYGGYETSKNMILKKKGNPNDPGFEIFVSITAINYL